MNSHGGRLHLHFHRRAILLNFISILLSVFYSEVSSATGRAIGIWALIRMSFTVSRFNTALVDKNKCSFSVCTVVAVIIMLPHQKRRIIKFSILTLMIGSTSLAITSTVGNDWSKVKGHRLFHQGLFHRCNPFLCFGLDAGVNLKVARAFMLVSCLCYGIGYTYIIMTRCVKGLHLRYLAVILFLTSTIQIAGLSVYTSEFGFHNQLEYGWSYILGWCAAILTMTAGLICFTQTEYKEILHEVLVNSIN